MSSSVENSTKLLISSQALFHGLTEFPYEHATMGRSDCIGTISGTYLRRVMRRFGKETSSFWASTVCYNQIMGGTASLRLNTTEIRFRDSCARLKKNTQYAHCTRMHVVRDFCLTDCILKNFHLNCRIRACEPAMKYIWKWINHCALIFFLSKI